MRCGLFLDKNALMKPSLGGRGQYRTRDGRSGFDLGQELNIFARNWSTTGAAQATAGVSGSDDVGGSTRDIADSSSPVALRAMTQGNHYRVVTANDSMDMLVRPTGWREVELTR